MPLINGLGGAFVFSDKPVELAEWYTEHFGFQFEGSAEFGAYYQTFWGLDPDNPEHKLDTTFSIIKANEPMGRTAPDEEPESMYGDQPYMMNLRTDDLDALVAHLESKGVTILKREDEEYGRFAWVRDSEGNRVELYEPAAQ